MSSTPKFNVGDTIRYHSEWCEGQERTITAIEHGFYVFSNGNKGVFHFVEKNADLVTPKPEFKLGDYVKRPAASGGTVKRQVVAVEEHIDGGVTFKLRSLGALGGPVPIPERDMQTLGYEKYDPNTDLPNDVGEMVQQLSDREKNAILADLFACIQQGTSTPVCDVTWDSISRVKDLPAFLKQPWRPSRPDWNDQ